MEAAVSAFPALIFPLPWGGTPHLARFTCLMNIYALLVLFFIYFGENSFTCMRPRDIPHGTGKS